MRAKKQLRNLGGTINRDPFGTGTVNYCIDQLSVTYPGTAIRTGCQEK
jgi:hypothetical protein